MIKKNEFTYCCWWTVWWLFIGQLIGIGNAWAGVHFPLRLFRKNRFLLKSKPHPVLHVAAAAVWEMSQGNKIWQHAFWFYKTLHLVSSLCGGSSVRMSSALMNLLRRDFEVTKGGKWRHQGQNIEKIPNYWFSPRDSREQQGGVWVRGGCAAEPSCFPHLLPGTCTSSLGSTWVEAPLLSCSDKCGASGQVMGMCDCKCFPASWSQVMILQI